MAGTSPDYARRSALNGYRPATVIPEARVLDGLGAVEGPGRHVSDDGDFDDGLTRGLQPTVDLPSPERSTVSRRRSRQRDHSARIVGPVEVCEPAVVLVHVRRAEIDEHPGHVRPDAQVLVPRRDDQNAIPGAGELGAVEQLPGDDQLKLIAVIQGVQFKGCHDIVGLEFER